MRALPLLALLSACGDDDPPGLHVIADISAEPPAYGRAPFPTDAVREGDRLGMIVGLDAIARGQTELVARHLAALDGFGLRPAIEFFLDGGVLPADALPAATTDCAVICVSDPGGTVVPYDWRYDEHRNVIAGSPTPGAQLLPATTYTAIITTALRPLARLPAFANAPERWRTTADAAAGRTDLAGIAVFTTSDATKRLRDARATLATVPAPTVTFDPALVFDAPAELDLLLGQATRATSGPRMGLERWGTDNATGIAHDHIGVVATGRMPIARFRADDTLTNGPEDETFQLGDDGKPRVIDAVSIPVTFVLPNTPAPATGYPVVLFGHGLGGSRHAMLNLAEPLAAAGYAVVAIDMWGHGSRFADLDSGNNLAGKAAFTGDRTLKDGFGDDPGTASTSLEFFESFLNVAAIRDTILQSALDFVQLARLVQNPAIDLSAIGAPRLDTTKLAYLGESFGTIVGTDLATIEPSIGLFILNVPGGGLLDQIMPNSAYIGSLALPLVQSIYRTLGDLDRFHPLLSLMQGIFDGADPLTFAPSVTQHVLAIEAIGDEIMANPGTIALGRALDLALLVPAYDDPPPVRTITAPATSIGGRLGVLVQYAPATHGYNWSAETGDLEFEPGFPHGGDDPFPKLASPVEVVEPIYETMEQVTHLLDTYRAGSPEVILTLAPIR